jgi:hypothetical protein
MMHLIQRIKHDLGDKHPFFNVVAVHIEESFLYLKEEESKIIRDQMLSYAQQCGVPLYIIPLEAIYLITNPSFTLKATNGIMDCDVKLLEKARKDVIACLETASSSTSKEDIVTFLREKLLGYVFTHIELLHNNSENQHFKCVKLGSASSASRLAIQLIADTCKGKGFSVAAQIAIEAPSIQGFNIHKLITFYNIKMLT